VSIVLIAIPTLAMGASYPIGIVAIEDPAAGIRDPEDLSQGAGALYAANTVGATLGAVLSGFVLLPSLGMSGTTLVAAALNAIAAAGAVALSSRTSAPSHPAPSHPAPLHPAPSHLAPSNVSHLAVPALALALSGFAALVFEVTWTRILAMILGPTTYAFSAMLVAFIAGLAIGSTAAAALIAHRRTPAFPHLRTSAPLHPRTPKPIPMARGLASR